MKLITNQLFFFVFFTEAFEGKEITKKSVAEALDIDISVLNRLLKAEDVCDVDAPVEDYLFHGDGKIKTYISSKCFRHLVLLAVSISFHDSFYFVFIFMLDTKRTASKLAIKFWVAHCPQVEGKKGTDRIDRDFSDLVEQAFKDDHSDVHYVYIHSVKKSLKEHLQPYPDSCMYSMYKSGTFFGEYICPVCVFAHVCVRASGCVCVCVKFEKHPLGHALTSRHF